MKKPGKIHFMDYRDRPACRRACSPPWVDANDKPTFTMTPNIDDVTCGGCLKTHRFRQAKYLRDRAASAC